MTKRWRATAGLLAGAGLCTAAGAQSTVALYGRVDLTIGRQVGSTATSEQNGSVSRIGLRGTEELGGTLKAVFNIEHGFNADAGTPSDANRFWNRMSYVGLDAGPYGRLTFGRDYTPAYADAQVTMDPFAHTMVASMYRINIGDIGTVRYDAAAQYRVQLGDFQVAGMVAEAGGPINNTPNKPQSYSIKFGTGGPLALAAGYDNPGLPNDHWATALAKYKVGGFTGIIGVGDGQTTLQSKRRSTTIAAIYTMGRGEWRAAYGQLQDRTAHVTLMSKLGVGYFYSLSGRTTVYVDAANDSKSAVGKTGYEVGLLHTF